MAALNSILTQNELKQALSYDPETGSFTWLVSNSNRVKVGAPAGCKTTGGYLIIGINKTLYKAHRLAWLYMHGEWPEKFIDHINGNPSDNRISNLRTCSQAENLQNLKACKTGVTGLAGAHPSNNTWKFRASISQNGKQVHLGYFETAELAHMAYLSKKAEIHKFQPTHRA